MSGPQLQYVYIIAGDRLVVAEQNKGTFDAEATHPQPTFDSLQCRASQYFIGGEPQLKGKRHGRKGLERQVFRNFACFAWSYVVVSRDEGKDM